MTIVPEPKERYVALGGDQLVVPDAWRIIATMNVFDKSLLYEMSYALMRRFAFIEVPSPDDSPDGDFHQLIDAAAVDDGGEYVATAASTAKTLMKVRRVKDIGPASYIDIARFAAKWLEEPAADDSGELAWEAFYSFLLPQFEGVDEREGRDLYRILISIVSQTDSNTRLIKGTLKSVLGVSNFALSPEASQAEEDTQREHGDSMSE